MKMLGACDSHLQVMIELEVFHLGLGENEGKFTHKTQKSMQIIIIIGEDNNYKKVVLFTKKKCRLLQVDASRTLQLQASLHIGSPQNACPHVHRLHHLLHQVTSTYNWWISADTD